MADDTPGSEELSKKLDELTDKLEALAGAAAAPPPQQDFAGDVRKEVLKRFTQYAATAIVALIVFALAGWWFYIQPRLVDIVGGVPKNGVVAFDTSDGCPENWTPFGDAAGRFIVGVGESAGLTARPYRSTGGAERVALALEHLPAHDHELNYYFAFLRGAGPEIIDLSSLPLINVEPGEGRLTTLTDSFSEEAKRTTIAGLGEGHDNIPPYLALHFCKKN